MGSRWLTSPSAACEGGGGGPEPDSRRVLSRLRLSPVAATAPTTRYMKNPYTQAGYPSTVPGVPIVGQDCAGGVLEKSSP